MGKVVYKLQRQDNTLSINLWSNAQPETQKHMHTHKHTNKHTQTNTDNSQYHLVVCYIFLNVTFYFVYVLRHMERDH